MRHLNPFLLLALLVTFPAAAIEPASETRQDEVAERGAKVMPFSLEKTTHVFSKTKYGGRQEVIAKDKSDSEQIRLIREHLSAIAEDFSRGDFTNPTRIHGEAMPGLKDMKAAKPGSIKYKYSEMPNGARIDYSTKDKVLIDAIHRFFDAQLSDHATHAIPGGDHSRMHGH